MCISVLTREWRRERENAKTTPLPQQTFSMVPAHLRAGSGLGEVCGHAEDGLAILLGLGFFSPWLVACPAVLVPVVPA